MIDYLIQKFVRNHEDTQSFATRRSYGNLSSAVGLFINLFLFSTKLIIGLLTNSIAIMADAINNLSDCFSIVIMVLSFSMSTKPADEKHPYGHSRLEYIFSSLITILVIYIGVKLVVASFKKIIHPEIITFNIYSLIVLIVAIVAKFWLSKFYYKISKKIDSDLLMATSVDSKSDCISTSIVLISVVVFKLTHLNIDAYIGLLGGVIIIKNGYEMITDTVDKLLGTGASRKFEREITDFITSYDGIYGAHDLRVHDYGPGHIFITVDVEVNSSEEFIKLHSLADRIERDLIEQKGVYSTIHMDPLAVNNPEVQSLHEIVAKIIDDVNDEWILNDFRICPKKEGDEMIFDIKVDIDEKMEDKEIVDIVKGKILSQITDYKPIIAITRGYQRRNFY